MLRRIFGGIFFPKSVMITCEPSSGEEWGLKKLAYPIQKKTTGFYFLIEFEAEGDIVDILETQYRRDERMIRFLTFKMDKYAVEYAEKRRNKYKSKQE